VDTFNVDANMFLFYLCGYFAGGVMAFFGQNSNSKRYLPSIIDLSIIEYLDLFFGNFDYFVILLSLCCGGARAWVVVTYF
jgi:hypothetical protein